MSSRISQFSSDDVEHLSNGFGRMGREYKSSRGLNHNGYFCNRQNGFDDEDDDEFKEEDIWGTSSSCDHSDYEKNNFSAAFQSAIENGGTAKGSKVRKSWLSMELQAVGTGGEKKEHVGVGFAVLEAVQKGGKESNGGWAPGFSARKVKIPSYVGGVGGSGCGNGWHEHSAGGKRGAVPQSAPVSMAVWPAKCGFGESNGGADADDTSDCENDCNNGNDDDGDDEDDDDERVVRLAPHEIIDREYARSQSTTFSVIEGAGRTLKGMDLRRVRNAVWSRTGFED